MRGSPPYLSGKLLLCNCSMAPFSVSSGIGSAPGKALKRGEKDVRVKLSAKQKQLKPGDTLVLHVEITNNGAEDIYVPRMLTTSGCVISQLKIVILQGPRHEGPGKGRAVDCSELATNDLRKAPIDYVLTNGWLLLPRGYSYAGDVSTDYTLHKPGRYLMGGKYASDGFYRSCLAGYEAELSRLRYEVWTGEVQLNPIWIEVIKPGRKK
jgi:hypothetical protein